MFAAVRFITKRFIVVPIALSVVGYASSPAAGAAPRHRPVVGQAYASRSTLPAAGAAVRVSIKVRYASRCVIDADRKPGAVKMGKLGAVSCGRGRARFTIPAIQNPSTSSIRVHFRVVARGSGGTARATFFIPEAGSQSPPPPPPQPSENWAGYIGVSSAPVTAVTATFAVPTLNCTATSSGSESTWDGIGGVKPGEALIQTGVESDCVSGVQTDWPWWEIVGGATDLPAQLFTSFPVQAGDILTATVTQNATSGAWLTCLSDAGTGEMGVMLTGVSAGIGQGSCASGNGISNYVPQADTSMYSYEGGTTAEWIAEDPMAAATQTLMPFPNFGTVAFSGIGVSSSATAVATEIVQGNQVLATPGPLANNSFTVSYTGP
jgi:hypothetical protein